MSEFPENHQEVNVPQAKDPEGKVLSPSGKKLLDAAMDIMENAPDEIGFVCRSMVSASMPHSRVKGIVYKRKTNNFTLSIVGSEDGGIPYGTYPRLILSWIASEVTKNKSREITLGASLSHFMKKLGLQVTGGRWGTVHRFKSQLKLLFSSVISFSYEDKKEGKWVHANMSVAEKSQIFWDPKNPDQIDIFNSKVLLGESFFNEILLAPIPVDIRAINALKDSSLALDIYFWLTYRMGYLRSPVLLSYERLQLQFGGSYQDTAQGRYEFKRKFLHQLKKVMTIYPDANIKEKEEGLFLFPSKSHIAKTKNQIKLI